MLEYLTIIYMKVLAVVCFTFIIHACTTVDKTADQPNIYHVDHVIRDEEYKDGPSLIFENSIHNFGKVSLNEEVKHTFHLKNMGLQPLIILNTIPTCGCTISSHPQKPIPPYGADSIVAVFKSSDLGKQNKVINIISNSRIKNQKLTIVAEVIY